MGLGWDHLKSWGIAGVGKKIDFEIRISKAGRERNDRTVVK